jgi:cytochrome c oxidase subunit III
MATMSQSTSEAPTETGKDSEHPPAEGEHASSGEHEHDAHGDDHGHGNYPFLAHHFDTPGQQFDAGKLGIWLFLLTEVLFFAGLFCAYTIYRSMRPEVFVYAHYFLDTKLGALNTCVLLISSLTAAWAVRNAQLGEKKKLIVNIVITIACACTFMVVKYFEYSHKAHEGLLWGKNFNPHHQVWEQESFKSKHPESAEYAEKIAEARGLPKHSEQGAPDTEGGGAPSHGSVAPSAAKTEAAGNAKIDVPPGTREEVEPLLHAGILGAKSQPEVMRPRNAHVFFGIYFFMTGLHGVHVAVGIGIWIWLLVRATKGVFGPMYFGPIDYAALYWHLVDLIWIYLFPLLYLIH